MTKIRSLVDVCCWKLWKLQFFNDVSKVVKISLAAGFKFHAPGDQGGSINILRRQMIHGHLQNSAKLAKKHSFLILNMKQICHWHCQGLK